MADDLTVLADAHRRIRVRVRGAVQGVGFRPFVWALAKDLGLSGWVLNDSEGVLIEVEGACADLFRDRLRQDAPSLSRIDDIQAQTVATRHDASFEIRSSRSDGPAATMVPADVAVCGDCLADILDPGNRRHLYPFTNCTQCGPRYTITRRLPYDRAETSMASFAMCDACQAEYDDPGNRRFHAQPNACPNCGPTLSHDLEDIADRLLRGEIIALKGLGGFHLVVDARNERAVARLRRRKQRNGKPFAVMVAGLGAARQIAEISPQEETLLASAAAPVVVCDQRRDNGLAASVSPGLPSVGLMLPYTPLHHVLFKVLGDRSDDSHPVALVTTSANPNGEPLVISNAEADIRLTGIADLVVTHDRDILIRCDDSVVRVIDGAPAYLRRARGLTPVPIALNKDLPPTLALGAHLKSTVCVIRHNEAFLSQHIGDLDNPATFKAFAETTDNLLSILDVKPDRVACDLHPEFHSTRVAEGFGLPVVRVQHHHAHIAAVCAEHHVNDAVLGLALDGFGLGEDGAGSWGGELLRIDGERFDRLGHLAPLTQPGGDRAAREPWRMAASALHALGLGRTIPERFPDQEGAELLVAMLDRGVNTAPTSSAGRLFDAASGLLGLRSVSAFEGDAAMALEALATCPLIDPNGWHIGPGNVLSVLPVLARLIDVSPSEGANLFHGTFAAALAEWVEQTLRNNQLPRRVVLSGGCFQNRVLTEHLLSHLRDLGIEPLRPLQAPANDGGLSLGQAFVAALSFLPEHKELDPCA